LPHEKLWHHDKNEGMGKNVMSAQNQGGGEAHFDLKNGGHQSYS